MGWVGGNFHFAVGIRAHLYVAPVNVCAPTETTANARHCERGKRKNENEITTTIKSFALCATQTPQKRLSLLVLVILPIYKIKSLKIRF